MKQTEIPPLAILLKQNFDFAKPFFVILSETKWSRMNLKNGFATLRMTAVCFSLRAKREFPHKKKFYHIKEGYSYVRTA